MFKGLRLNTPSAAWNQNHTGGECERSFKLLLRFSSNTRRGGKGVKGFTDGVLEFRLGVSRRGLQACCLATRVVELWSTQVKRWCHYCDEVTRVATWGQVTSDLWLWIAGIRHNTGHDWVVSTWAYRHTRERPHTRMFFFLSLNLTRVSHMLTQSDIPCKSAFINVTFVSQTKKQTSKLS